ncbi:hypothetical protein [Streptomyces sp. NPDC102282]|uniref:hypothetical protein n=1 Tax=Streptomyces sp. NPDC102282 TaxID=3366154 RepID=UPI00382718DE
MTDPPIRRTRARSLPRRPAGPRDTAPPPVRGGGSRAHALDAAAAFTPTARAGAAAAGRAL